MSNENELLDAIRKGDAATVAALLDADPALLRASAGPTSAILLAVYHGHADIARLFTDRGAELAFGESIALGEGDRVRAMLDQDPSLLHAFTPDGFPPAGFAIFFHHPELARELIERGADVNAAARNDQRVAPVHAAAAACDAASMRLLLERGADPNVRQQVGFTALHGSAASGDRATAELLLAHGAYPNPKNDEGKTPADFAAERGHAEFAEWLRRQPDPHQP
jgi:ankyrin repeat protein